MTGVAKFKAFVDGSCDGAPGCGGWGVVFIGEKIRELSGGSPDTTSARMELTAAIQALIATPDGAVVTLVVDSRMVAEGLSGGAVRWRRGGWRKANDRPVSNSDLWKNALELCRTREVSVEWVKAHSGDQHNERAHAIANEARERIQEEYSPGSAL